MLSRQFNRRHGFSGLRFEPLERRLLFAVADVEACENIGLDLLVADRQYAGIDGQGFSVATGHYARRWHHRHCRNRQCARRRVEQSGYFVDWQ
jgi:hypothetical protein